MEKALIPFYETMISNKRGPGAYLRKNILTSNDGGLYPSTDFLKKVYASSATATNAFFIKNKYVFVTVGGNTAVYRSTTSSTLSFLANLPDSSPVIAVSDTNDANTILVLLSNGIIYTITNSIITLRHTIAGNSATGFIVYDGLFWYISFNAKLYRLDPDLSTVIIAKNTTATQQFHIVNMQIFNGYVIVTRSLGNFIQFDFWSIAEADIDLYQKRVVEENCRHLGVGVIGGRLIFTKSVGNASNIKEKYGNIVVTAFDGEKFIELNSIRAGKRNVTISGTQPQSVGNGIMTIAIKENTNTLTGTLFENWLLKIKENGEIETLMQPSDVTNGFAINCVNIEYDTISVIIQESGGNRVFYEAIDGDEDYNEYQSFNHSVYATNFLNNSRNVHRLLSFGVSFEKVWDQITADTGERLFIDYRTSERDAWTLLHEVNSEKIKDYTADEYSMALREVEYASDSIGQTIQSYVITKMPDNTELPRFNEIQFRFRSKKGFSLLQAWYNYEVIIRNTA